MKLTVDGAWKKTDYTISRFYISGRRFYETLEDRDRALFQTMPIGKILQKKVYGQTVKRRKESEAVLEKA